MPPSRTRTVRLLCQQADRTSRRDPSVGVPDGRAAVIRLRGPTHRCEVRYYLVEPRSHRRAHGSLSSPEMLPVARRADRNKLPPPARRLSWWPGGAACQPYRSIRTMILSRAARFLSGYPMRGSLGAGTSVGVDAELVVHVGRSRTSHGHTISNSSSWAAPVQSWKAAARRRRLPQLSCVHGMPEGVGQLTTRQDPGNAAQVVRDQPAMPMAPRRMNSP